MKPSITSPSVLFIFLLSATLFLLLSTWPLFLFPANKHLHLDFQLYQYTPKWTNASAPASSPIAETGLSAVSLSSGPESKGREIRWRCKSKGLRIGMSVTETSQHPGKSLWRALSECLNQWFSKQGPQARSISITQKLVRKMDAWPSKPAESETQGGT